VTQETIHLLETAIAIEEKLLPHPRRSLTGRSARYSPNTRCLSAPAPSLNPIVYLWGYVKGNDLANFCANDLKALTRKAKRAFQRKSGAQSHIKAFWIQSELKLELI
jgi:hypothetical protein